MKQTLTLTNRVHLPLGAQPVRHGVPWPIGAVRDESTIVLTDEHDRRLPVATRVLNRWPDGSIQWSLLDLIVDFEPSATRTITINAAEAASPTSNGPVNAVVVRRVERGILLSNGLTALTVLVAPGDSLIDSKDVGAFDVTIVDADGVGYRAARCEARRVWVEDANALRAIVRIDGKHQSDDGRALLDFWLRFTLTADNPDVTITYHYRNRESREPGVNLRSIAMDLRPPIAATAERAIVQVNRGRSFRTEPVRLREDFEICASNSMDLATYPQTHVGLTGGGAGRVFIRQPELLRDDPMRKPWFLRNVVDFKFQSGDAPEAYVWNHIALVGEDRSFVFAGANMIGLHPKSLSVRGNQIRYAIWPEWAGTMDVTQGEGRTLDFLIGPISGRATDAQIINRAMSWSAGSLYAHWGAQRSVTVSMDAAHVRRCRVFQIDRLPDYAPSEHFAFERKVQAQWTPDGPPPANGHWHYGDVFARWDIGANNEEMVGHVWFQEYLRTGRANCLERGIAQARHIADVDVCAHSADPYQNGGMCAHGPRHNHCAAYPSHMWFTEMLFAYALSGDEEFKKTARLVSDNLCFWVNDEAGFEIVKSDGRESGQPLINLAWVYPFIPDPKYLDAIRKIVRESFVERVNRHGALVYMKPREDLPLVKFASYGEWAAWEGLFCAWELTRDEDLRRFILSQLETRLTESRMNTAGSFRDTDFNVAAYAYYLSDGDTSWLDRVARPFRACFRAVQWPFGYVKSMYFLRLAFEHGIVRDEDVLIG